MSATTSLVEVSNQIQKFWSELFMPDFQKSSLLPSLVNKDYEGEIKQGGDTVYVSAIRNATGENLIVGTNADTFNPEAITTDRIAIQANRRAVASFKIQDLAQLQSQLTNKDSAIRAALLEGIKNQINAHLYSLVAPSAASPDHVINSVTAFDATALAAHRQLAATSRWSKAKGWWTLVDPSYYTDLLGAQTLVSKDYIDGEAPLVGGQIANKRFGFNILEDDSMGVDQALSFCPDFLHLVTQKAPTFKVSDLHANKEFGYLISVDVVYGAALGIDGAKKHIVSTASASEAGIVVSSS